ncbi:MAG: EamA family transporter [Thermofilum sp.]|nr:EamA family transporter [Thermofilum sp.]
MKMNEWLILAVLDAFFAALATIFAKIGLQNVDSRARFLALQKGETTPVSLVDKSSLAFVVLLSVLVLHEELTLKKIVAVGLVLAAIYILAI